MTLALLVLLLVIAAGYFVLRDMIGPRNAAIVAVVFLVAWFLFAAGGVDLRAG